MGRDLVTSRLIDGSAEFRRLNRIRFPTEELVDRTGVVAHLGRDGSLRIFFGPGRRVRLSDGDEWRIKATTFGRHIVPIITSDEGKVAVSSPLFARQSYGLNGKDYGLTLIPLGKSGMWRPSSWALRRHDVEIATIDFPERRISPAESIPLSAVILAFTLIMHGIPGEAELTPERD